MTENLPEIRTDTVPVAPDTDSWVQVVGDVAKLAAHVADTEFVPRGLRGSAAAVTAAILYGREAGLPPMTALRLIHVIEGTPSMAAEGKRALVLAAGHDLEIREATGAYCVAAGRRRGTGTWREVKWTIDNAKQAGLVRPNSAWTRYPRAMLVARATGELCDQMFADVTHGFRTVEELTNEPGTIPLELGDPNGGAPAKTTVQRAQKPPEPPKTRPEPSTTDTPNDTPTTPPTAPPPPPLPGEPGYDGVPKEHPAADTPSSTGESAPAAGPKPPPAEDGKTDDWPATKTQHALYMIKMQDLGVTDRDERLWITSHLIGEPGRALTTSKDLTRKEIRTILDTLRMVQSREQLQAIVEMAAGGIQGTLQEEPPEDEP